MQNVSVSLKKKTRTTGKYLHASKDKDFLGYKNINHRRKKGKHERVTGRKARGPQREEIGCCQINFFFSLS